VVWAAEGGTFVVKDGSRIEGANWSGVDVVDKGVFTMDGGTINGNTVEGRRHTGGVYVRDGVFTMSGGTISENRVFQSGVMCPWAKYFL
jgi:hypothetical protein